MSSASGFVYKRSSVLAVLIAAGAVFALTDIRLNTWAGLLPFFEWMETTPFGVIGKTWGAAFAAVEAVHLLGMAVLGGAVLVGDARLFGFAFSDAPMDELQAQCHRLFVWALGIVIFTGVFMACGVASKIYYLEVFWYKMLALLVGVLFAFFVRRPLVVSAEHVSPGTLRLAAVASIMIWFSVAATGRWIGFSG